MNKEKVVPEIRFEGFSDNWDTKELSKVTERVVRKNVDLVSMNPLTISAQVGLISQLDYYNFQVASKNLSNYYLLSKGDFAYNKSYSAGYPVGAIKRLDYYEKGLLSTLYIIFRPTNVNSEFLKHYYESNYWHKGIYDIAEEGARNHGLLNVAPIQFFETHLNLPVSDLEQSRIGNLFEKIEGNIKKREQEIFKLKNFKKAMLQKMFPKEGETVPEVRFEGFKGEWAEIEIGDIGEVVTGNTPPTKDESNYSKEGILWVTPTDIKGSKTTKTDKMLSETGLIKARTVPSGSILVTSIASIGKNTMILEEAGFNQQINAVVPKREFDSYFLLFLSNHWSNKMKKTAASGTMQIVNRSEFSKIMTKIPSYNEQKKIGKYFNVVDENIQSKQAELDKLTQFKQAMLDKMFV